MADEIRTHADTASFPGGHARFQQVDDEAVIVWEPDGLSISRQEQFTVPRERIADHWNWFREERLPGLLGGRGVDGSR